MRDESFFPPSPDVQHLPTLFRRIQQGEIRVPAFQRGFVWKEAQTVELLESVYRGFPIGSLLFWSVKDPVLRIEKEAIFPFPDVPEQYPLKFLLDGLQRLSTLYGVFHWPDPLTPGQYSMLFDLDNEEFRKHIGGPVPRRTIHLSSLFSPRAFLGAQRFLSLEDGAEELMEKTVKLHSIFQEYMIPTVTIENRTVPEVVAVFERVNSTGTKLNAVDFMRAVTWSQDFDLNTELKTLFVYFKKRGFEIKVETIVKALAVIKGFAPTPEAMLQLRSLPAESLHEGMAKLRQLIEESRIFLLEHFQIRSAEYLPYEGQLLALIKFLGINGASDPHAVNRLVSWIWATSFNEELRGKPDHFVTRILDRVEDLVAGAPNALSVRLTLSAEDLTERRFIKGKALSAAFACMFAKRRARSLVTGFLIPPEYYMQEFTAKSFDGLIGLKPLSKYLRRSIPSQKLLANSFLFTEEDLYIKENVSTQQLLKLSAQKSEAEEIFRSQFMTPELVEACALGNLERFLRGRAALLISEAQRLSS